MMQNPESVKPMLLNHARGGVNLPKQVLVSNMDKLCDSMAKLDVKRCYASSRDPKSEGNMCNTAI